MFSKQVIVYQDDGRGNTVKSIDGVVEGEVVNEGNEDGWNPFKWFGALFGKANPERDTSLDHCIDVESEYTCDVKGHEDYQFQLDTSVLFARGDEQYDC